MKHMRLTKRHWMLGLMCPDLFGSPDSRPCQLRDHRPSRLLAGSGGRDSHTGGELAGQTTYRVYMNMQNATDYLSSCSGDSENPLILESSSGTWYNNPYNSSLERTRHQPLVSPSVSRSRV